MVGSGYPSVFTQRLMLTSNLHTSVYSCLALVPEPQEMPNCYDLLLSVCLMHPNCPLMVS